MIAEFIPLFGIEYGVGTDKTLHVKGLLEHHAVTWSITQ